MSIQFHPGQQQVLGLLSRHREVCVIAGRGWGKSFLGAHLLAFYGERIAPPYVLWWISKEKQQARAIGFDYFVSEFRDIVEHANTNEATVRLKSGVRIEFVGTDQDPDALRGRNVAMAVWDEPFLSHFPFLDSVLRPSLRHPESRLLLIGTMPHVHEDFDPRWLQYVSHMRAQGLLYVGTSRENEGYGLPVGWVDERLAEAEASGASHIARYEYLCDLGDIDAYTLIPSSELAIAKRMPLASSVVFRCAGIDPHLSRSNAVVVVEYLRDGSVFIYDAAYVEQPLRRLSEYLERIARKRGAFTHYFVDERMVRQHVNLKEGYRILDLFYELGMPVQPGQIEPLVWLEDIRRLVDAGKLQASPACRSLIEQLKLYTGLKVTGKFKKRWRREFDLVDALRYAMSMRLHRVLPDESLGLYSSESQKALGVAYV